MPATVYEKLVQSAGRYPDNDLLVFPGRLRERWQLPQASWSYRATVEMVEPLAARYKEAGYGPGQRVALLMENRPSHFFHWLALNSLGVSKVPLNPDYRMEEARYVLEHSEAQLVVAADAVRERILPAAEACALPVVSPDAESFPGPRHPPAAGALREETECALLYTSGTTGKPKGCMLSNGYFFGWGEWYEAQRGFISLRPGRERLMQVLPTFHINAVGNSFMGMVFTGGAQVMADRFHSSSWWKDAIETKATCFHYLGVIPAMLMNLAPSEHDRAHELRFGMGGGVHPAHHAAFEARFGVRLLEGWAMTETGGGGIMVALQEPRHVGECCIGRPDRNGPPLEVRVADDEGNEVPRGEPGELLVRARGAEPRRRFFSGYFKDAAATQKAWQGGWLHTGDIMSQDSDGNLFFLDRKKNIIRRSGENIAGIEVESAVLTHPAVGQVAVLAARDEIRGEEVMAVVATKPGYTAGLALAEEIADHCLSRLAYYKAPGYIVFRSELPTTSTQKVRVNALGDLMKNPASQKDCFDLRERKQRARKASPSG
jgi:acyl-CoA synthetase (AMP-forming)/AMP-acid ligase II